jgi:predicted small metal-binding protein
MEQVVNAIVRLQQEVVAIVNHIKQTHKTTEENNAFLVKTIQEQREINENLKERVKALEDVIAEHYLLGDKK